MGSTDPRSKYLGGSIPLLGVSGVASVNLVWELSLDFSRLKLSLITALDGQNAATLWETTLEPAKLSEKFSATQEVLRETVGISVDLYAGELNVNASIGYWLPEKGWTDIQTKEQVCWNPTLGSAGGQTVAHAPVVNDPAFGTSTSIVPTVTRIVVDDKARLGTDVGNKVKKVFFAQEPAFFFNVSFAVGHFLPGFAGPYADPESIWYNVFIGYYEIDVPASRGRPFGYKTTSASGRQIDPQDLMRIGKADWNYFSNYIYGVPEARILPHNGVPPDVVAPATTERIAGREWDSVTMDGMDVVSAYAPQGKGLVDNAGVLSPMWRGTFGSYSGPRPNTTPFPGITMQAAMYMSFRAEGDRYKTMIFGGTVSELHPAPGFRDAQMAACRQVIAAHFATLGFP